MKSIDCVLLNKVNAAIADMKYPTQPKGLYEPIRYALSMGGKRIRPVFLLLAYGLYQSDYDKVMNAAIGIETYHNYTLLHDDLMDRADLRRGKPTVHKKWNSNTAILSGDSMLVMACKLILSAQSPRMRKILEIFVNTALEIGEGQQYDMNFETQQGVTEEEYIEMIRLKTSVLIACAVKMGALLGGSSDADADVLYRFGEQIGLAFQLQDDYLDVYGNPEVFGKRIGGDILCNKKTFLLINALQMATPSQRDVLESWIQRENFDESEKIKAITALYDVMGIGEICQERINHFFEEARLLWEQLNLPVSCKQPLWDFAESLLNRKY